MSCQQHIQTKRVRKNALDPADDDLLVQITTLSVGKPVPAGWKVTSKNMHNSEIVRVVQRHALEIE